MPLAIADMDSSSECANRRREIQLPEPALYGRSRGGHELPHGAFEGDPGSVYTLRTSTQGSGGFEARNSHLVRSTIVYRRRRGHVYTHNDILLSLRSMLNLNGR